MCAKYLGGNMRLHEHYNRSAAGMQMRVVERLLSKEKDEVLLDCLNVIMTAATPGQVMKKNWG